MNILSVESSTERVSFAIMIKGEVCSVKSYYKKQSASEIIVHIKHELERLCLSVSDFDAFCVGAGPGSFTGLRVSFSIVKGFAFALDKPVISIGSFFSCAYQIKDSLDRIAVIADARRNLIYAAPFRVSGGKVIREKKEGLYVLDDFVRRYKNYTYCTYHSYLREKIELKYGGVKCYPADIWPGADVLVSLARDYYRRGRFVSLNRLQPLYIYPADCQVRKVSIKKSGG